MTKSSEEKMGRKWKEDKEGRRRKRKSKGESERDNRGRNECWGVRRFFLCPSSSRSPVTVTGLVIGRGPVSLSLSRGCAPQREPRGPEIADDKIEAAFHSIQGYPALP